jgi:DNA polymerase III subunit epsilon
MNILFLDTETSGLDPKVHGILQIAAEFHQDGKLIKSFNEKCNTNIKTIDLGALKVNKVAFGSIKNLTPNEVVLKLFVDFILGLPANTIIAGHNVSFDINFLKEWLTVNGVTGWGSIFSHRVLDTYPLAAYLKEIGAIKTDKLHLENIAEALNIAVNKSDLHSAQYDVELTAKIYYKIVELGQLLVDTNPIYLMDKLSN